MTVIFNDDDLVNAFRQKQRIWYIYVGVMVVFIALCAACIAYYVSLPYEDPMQPVPIWIVCVASCVFVIFSYIFSESNSSAQGSIIRSFPTFRWG